MPLIESVPEFIDNLIDNIEQIIYCGLAPFSRDKVYLAIKRVYLESEEMRGDLELQKHLYDHEMNWWDGDYCELFDVFCGFDILQYAYFWGDGENYTISKIVNQIIKVKDHYPTEEEIANYMKIVDYFKTESIKSAYE